MRKILFLILALILATAASAEQRFLVTENGVASDWTSELPEAYDGVLSQIAAEDAASAKAGSVYLYPDGDGCWVFCRTVSDVYHGGKFWYVGGKVHLLGAADDVWTWNFVPGEGVFYVITGEPEHRAAHAMAAPEGTPVHLSMPDGIVSLTDIADGRALCGVKGPLNFDYTFLTVDGTALRELPARVMEPAEFTALPGAQEILMELTTTESAVVSASFLKYDNGIIRLNGVLDDGSHCHAYLWQSGNTLSTFRGWEDEIILVGSADSQ